MRMLLVLLAGTIASLPSLIAAPAAAPEPCTTATASCTEWVTLGSGPARSLVYRTFSLGAKNENIPRALIMVHGTNRNADHYFTTATTAAFLGRALDDTGVISPRIASSEGSSHDTPPDEARRDDTLADNEVSWGCTGDSWRAGRASPKSPSLTSFDFVDPILRK